MKQQVNHIKAYDGFITSTAAAIDSSCSKYAWLSIDTRWLIRLFRIHPKETQNLCVSLLRGIRDIVDPQKTIFVSGFNFDFPQEKLFSIKETTVSSGFFGEALRRDFYSNRVINCFYSFFVFGKDESLFLKKIFHNGTGPDSVMSEIIKAGCDVFTVGHHFNKAFSAVHHVEQIRNVNYRYVKKFEGVVDTLTDKFESEFSFFVRDVELCSFSSLTERGELEFRRLGLVQSGLIDTPKGAMLYHRFKLTKAVNFLLSLEPTDFLTCVSPIPINNSNGMGVLTPQIADKLYIKELKSLS